MKLCKMSSLCFSIALQNTDLAIALSFLNESRFLSLRLTTIAYVLSCNQPCVRVHEDSATGLEDSVKMKISRVCIITTMLNVLFLFISCPREIHNEIFACSCVLAFSNIRRSQGSELKK